MINTSGSGDHPEVEADAVRAVAVGGNGNPPSSAAASAAASLPPTPPSTSDSVVQPRATDSSSPCGPPLSNATRHAGERPSDGEENSRLLDCLAASSDGSEAFDDVPLPTATTNIDAVLPHLTSYAAASDDNNNNAPVPPVQIAADCERMEVAIKELSNDNDDNAPVPPTQIAADFERMDGAIKELSSDNNDNAPVPPAQIAAEDFERMDGAIKELSNDNNDNAPVPPTQIDADFGRTDGEIKELSNTPLNVEDMPMHPSQIGAEFDNKGEAVGGPMIVEHEETLQQAQDPPTPVVARAPSPPPTDQGRSPSNPRGQQQPPVRPPPQSMMPSPDEGTEPPASALPREPSEPVLEATLVEDQPEIPVYDAFQVAEQTRFEKNKKIIIGVGVGLLIGAAVATAVSVSSNNGSSGSNTIQPEGIVLSIAGPLESLSPSDSSSPSQFPSVRPTLQPSQSANPSQSPSRSLHPSLYPSISASPTPFCFGGEINILSDSYPEDINWKLSRIDNGNGVANSKVVLEGSPEREGDRTSDEVCLERGDYEFVIFDSYGDGIASPGYYSVTFDGVEVAHGREFGFEEKVSFSLPLPSGQPSESFSPSQSLSPSLRPSNSFSPSSYWSTFNWNRQGLGFNGDASANFFGRAVTFSADALTMAVGAPGNGSNDDKPGYVKVYHREGEGSSWEQRGETIHGEANGVRFGFSLSLSDDGLTLSVGAPPLGIVGSDSGQVTVYKWDEAALDFVQVGDTLHGAASGDEFGRSLDISDGKILAVGAKESDANGSARGQVAIYAWDEASSNFQQRGEAINGDADGDHFGYSVTLTGNGEKLAVGAYGNDSNGSDSGQVKVFEWDGTTSNYKQLGESLLGDAADDWFGRSVSFSHDGTTLAVGAFRNSKNGLYSGQAKVFAWNESASNFEQIGQSLYGTAVFDNFGAPVVLSSEGKTLAIGATQFCKPGYVEVYRWDEAASEYERLGQSLGGEAPGDQFGSVLALAANGRVLAVGAPLNDGNGTDSGRVEVFNVEP